MHDNSRPIFLQLAERLEDDILSGISPEESQIPSINELAVFHRINPATALKAINLLVEEGVLYKKRGIGMFVSPGARELLREKHNQNFRDEFVEPLLNEASQLGISIDQIIQMLRKGVS